MENIYSEIKEVEHAICIFMSEWLAAGKLAGMADLERRRELSKMIDTWNDLHDMLD